MRIDSTGVSPATQTESAKTPETLPQQTSEAKSNGGITFNLTQSQKPISFGNETAKPDEHDNGLKQKIATTGENLKGVPGLGNLLKGIGNSEAGVGNTLAGGLKGIGKTLENSIKGAIEGGSRTPQEALANAYITNVENFDTPKK
jgi:hypothetical protein